MSKYVEQITAYEAKRGALVGSMEAIMSTAADAGATLDAAQQEEYDGFAADIKAVDDHLGRLRTMEATTAVKAKPVGVVVDDKTGTAARSGIVIKAPKLEPGIQFARMAKCIGLGHKMHRDPVAIAEERYKNDPAVINAVKAAVAAATTGHATWAGPLVGDETAVFADFVEFLRPQTIVGRFGANGIPSLRRVPFRVPLIGQTSGGNGYWVGEGKAKPLTKFDFERKTLEPLKVANIAVATMETLRDSSPSAETIIRDQLAAALKERLDLDFIDPAKAAVANISPASITNGVTPIVSSGPTADNVRTDIKAIFEAFIAANNAPTSGVWIMPATVALSLSLMQNPLGQAEFPGISMNGGTLFGLPVIVSEYVPTLSAGAYVILANASDIYLADDGEIAVDMSQEASLEMSDTPVGTSDVPTVHTVVSMFQTNSVAFRAERTISWLRRRTSAVAVLSGVTWGA